MTLVTVPFKTPFTYRDVFALVPTNARWVHVFTGTLYPELKTLSATPNTDTPTLRVRLYCSSFRELVPSSSKPAEFCDVFWRLTHKQAVQGTGRSASPVVSIVVKPSNLKADLHLPDANARLVRGRAVAPP